MYFPNIRFFMIQGHMYFNKDGERKGIIEVGQMQGKTFPETMLGAYYATKTATPRKTSL